MQKIIIATSNQGKIAEFNQLAIKYNIELIPQQHFNITDAEETGTTFIENAIIKAKNAAKVTNMPAIADDSGIEVQYLQQQPGVYSARYISENATNQERYNNILQELTGVPTEKRLARFQCVLVYLRNQYDANPIIGYGTWNGYIQEKATGINGHGYDPIFFSPEYKCSAAELTNEQKNKLSHRNKAFKSLMQQLYQHQIIANIC